MLAVTELHRANGSPFHPPHGGNEWGARKDQRRREWGLENTDSLRRTKRITCCALSLIVFFIGFNMNKTSSYWNQTPTWSSYSFKLPMAWRVSQATISCFVIFRSVLKTINTKVDFGDRTAVENPQSVCYWLI